MVGVGREVCLERFPRFHGLVAGDNRVGGEDDRTGARLRELVLLLEMVGWVNGRLMIETEIRSRGWWTGWKGDQWRSRRSRIQRPGAKRRKMRGGGGRRTEKLTPLTRVWVCDGWVLGVVCVVSADDKTPRLRRGAGSVRV